MYEFHLFVIIFLLLILVLQHTSAKVHTEAKIQINPPASEKEYPT